MANPEHIAILRQGVLAWKRWRAENPQTRPDLTEANLSGANLAQANLTQANLIGANLTEARLIEAKLIAAKLMEADLRGANLRGAALDGANLRGANLREANLDGAKLIRAHLAEANLTGANLSGARLLGTHLIEANLTQANLSGANLTQANLSGADLIEVNLSQAVVGWTVFGNVDLSVVKGLETVEHAGPSTLGIDTIYRSRDQIANAFLRGCGLPDNFITYIGSLVGQPIQFYSCFISYSTKDQAFANRLHADLQAEGVRCWFAPEDLKIGDKFRDRIDESIRLYDKLLIILSENSVQSSWVATEVEAAFEREHRQKEAIVLFPVRIDDAVMDTQQAWAADIRRRRHIGDFSHWKDHDSYTRAFKRLLRDLKPEPQAPNNPA